MTVRRSRQGVRGGVAGTTQIEQPDRNVGEDRPAAWLLHTGLPGPALLGALVFAPWFWGCTWPLGIRLLDIFTLSSTAIWGIGILLRGKALGLPQLLVVAVFGLLAQGWMMALNGHSICDEDTGLLIPVAGHLEWLPGSIDQDRSRDDMLRITGLLGAGLISAWLGRSRSWRRAILWTLAATGLSLSALGCLQRSTRATDIFWNTGRHPDFFFATYRNVTNAGEYFNLVLPPASALTLAAVMKREPARVALGAVATTLLMTGSVVCGSKVAPVVSGASVILFVTLNRAYLRRRIEPMNMKTRLMTCIVLVMILGAVVQSVGLEITRDRWSRLFSDRDGTATLAHRLLVGRVCVLAAPDAGLAGFGPATFRAIFPYYSERVAGDLTGVWSFAHDDYAQTLLEWGGLGSALWSSYFFGGWIVLARYWWRANGKTEDRIHASGLLLAQLSIGLMALVDFPLQIASIQLDVAVVLGLAWSSGWWPRAILNEVK